MFKAFKKKMKDQRGLTLIELLAVIVILGIIAAIAIPSIGGIINKSKEDAKVAEALQIISAAKLAHASKSDITNWKNTEDKTGTPVYGGLSGTVSNVKDTNYTVSYEAGVYYITNHDASKTIGEDENEKVSEQQLINFTK